MADRVIADIYLNPVYWISVGVLVAAGALLTRARLGFRFIIIVLLAQYTVHSALAFGADSDLFFFCAASFAAFVVLTLPIVSRWLATIARRSRPAPGAASPRGVYGRIFFHVGRIFLLGYWAAHLVAYPLSFGDLDLGTRLAAQEQDRVLFFLGQVTLPAFAACMVVWLRRDRRLRWLDVLTIALTLVGLVSSESKATVLPIVLAFFGAMEMSGRRLGEFKKLLLPGAGLLVLALGRLLLFFPGQSPLQVGETMVYRVAANTDSLEYLKVLHLRPSDFPFAGLPALLPYIAKMFGYRYDYSPGAWVFGERYGNFAGFGPNSGPVLDYFGNIGWFGLAIPILAALALGAVRSSSAPQAVAAASIAYLAFIDVTLFDLPLMFWGAVGVLVALLSSRPMRRVFGALRGRRVGVVVGRSLRWIDSPLPRLRRRRGRHVAEPDGGRARIAWRRSPASPSGPPRRPQALPRAGVRGRGV